MTRVCHVSKRKLFKAFEEVYNSSHLTEGVMVKRFEAAASELQGNRAIAVSNAGTALYTLLSCLPKKTGRVVVPNNTFFATGAMAREAGWEVVLADCGEDFCLTSDTIMDACGWQGVDGVILTHVGGPMATEYEAIARRCQSRNMFLLEDAAHAYGVRSQNGNLAGSMSTAAVFSFYPTKAIPAGEGGLIVSKDVDLLAECEIFRNYGKYKIDGQIRYMARGWNFRMDEWTAAVAWLQTERIKDIFENREEVAFKLAQVSELHPAFKTRPTNWYKFVAKPNPDFKKLAGKVYAKTDQLSSALGIPGHFPVSERVAEEHICLPLQEGMYDSWPPGLVLDYLTGE